MKGFVGKLRASGGALQTLWSIFAASGRCSLCLVGNPWEEKEISCCSGKQEEWIVLLFLKWKNRVVTKWMHYSQRYKRDVSLLCFWIIRGKGEPQWDASAIFFSLQPYLFSITLAQYTLSAKCTYLHKWKQKSHLVLARVSWGPPGSSQYVLTSECTWSSGVTS